MEAIDSRVSTRHHPSSNISTSGGASQGAIVKFPESSLNLDGRSSSSGSIMPLPQVEGSGGIELDAIYYLWPAVDRVDAVNRYLKGTMGCTSLSRPP
jgi:hypothetical protein